VVLAINAWDEPKKRIARFVQKEKLKQHMLLDGGEVWKGHYDGLLPQVVWIDREGVIVEREIGFDAQTSPGIMAANTKRLVESAK